jgi:hypothetical protein
MGNDKLDIYNMYLIFYINMYLYVIEKKNL